MDAGLSRKIEKLQTQVCPDQLADDLWRLVRISSPTGREREAAIAFAEMLERAGAAVQVFEDFPDSPSVVGRLKGSHPGQTLQLSGHLDHIDIPHAPPLRTESRISGRGSADMKGGLAGALELVRVLAGDGRGFPGEILVTAYGLHEAPVGDSRGLRRLIERNILGDAALVLEGPTDKAIVRGKGQAIWNLNITREGAICHELSRPHDADRLLSSTQSFIQVLLDKNNAMGKAPHQDSQLGPESVFIGQVHYGDFYNRAPIEAGIQGTWRWLPGGSFESVKRELHSLLKHAGLTEKPGAGGVVAKESWQLVGEAYEIDGEEPIVRAVRQAFRRMTGRDMELSGTSLIIDTSKLVPYGGIPAVPIGLAGVGAHADYEYVDVQELAEGCRMVLAALLTFLLTRA